MGGGTQKLADKAGIDKEAGLHRMAMEFHKYPDQYKVNRDELKQIDDEFMTGYLLLKNIYETGIQSNG